MRGGFPESFLAANDADSLAYRLNFIATYLERDMPQFSPRPVAATTLERLWRMLAHAQGSLLNASALAAGLSINAPMVTRYVDLLTDLLLVRRLPPFIANTRKRLVKSPKVYVRDSGLVHGLLGIQDEHTLTGHPVMGASWEGFVIENLLAVAPWWTLASFLPHRRRRRDRPCPGTSRPRRPLGHRDQAQPRAAPHPRLPPRARRPPAREDFRGLMREPNATQCRARWR